MSQSKDANTHLWRLLLGFLLAPLVGALVLLGPLSLVYTLKRGLGPSSPAEWDMLQANMMGVGLAALAGVVLGVPTYVALRGRLKPRLITIVVVAALLAAVPPLLMSLLGGHQWKAADAWAILAFLRGGAAGGAVFWLCVFWRQTGVSAPIS